MVRVRMPRAWEPSRTRMAGRVLAHVSSSAAVRVGGGSDVGTYSRYVPYLVFFTDTFALYVALVMYKDGPVHQESTARPLKGHLSSRYETQKSIKYRRGLVCRVTSLVHDLVHDIPEYKA